MPPCWISSLYILLKVLMSNTTAQSLHSGKYTCLGIRQTWVSRLGSATSECCSLRQLLYPPLASVFSSIKTEAVSSGSMRSQNYSFAQAVITEYHRLGDLHNRNVFSHSSGGWKSEIQVTAGSVSLLGLYMAAFSLCLHMAFPLCISVS